MKTFKQFLVEVLYKADFKELIPSDYSSSHEIKKYIDHNNVSYYVKTPSTYLYENYIDPNIHLLVEYLSYKIYSLFGIPVPDVDLYIDDDTISLASTESKGKHILMADLPKFKDFVKGFAVDIFIANWDVAGSGKIAGNLIIDNKGAVTRIDPGGALSFRARGARKGNAFSDSVLEIDTMRNNKYSPPAETYNSHYDEIKLSFKTFLSHPWNTIKANIIKFNNENIIDVLTSENKFDIVAEWETEFKYIMNKLHHRYYDMIVLSNKLHEE